MISSNKALAEYNITLIDSMRRVTKTINSKAIHSPQLSLQPTENNQPPIFFDTQTKELKIQFKSF